MSRPVSTPLIARLTGAAIRVVVGVLWLREGWEKYHAGFGAQDILLVADGAESNPRTPWWFDPLGSVMQAAPAAFGVLIPALEVLLGVALVLGVQARIVALASIATLMLYWGSDQLIWQYPAMALLSALVLAIPVSGELGVGMLLRRRRSRSSERAPAARM